MEYYIISLFISIITFIIIQYIEYNNYKKNIEENINVYDEPYNLFKMSNILLFFIIYLVFTIGLFYLKPSLPSFLDFSGIINNDGSNKQKTDGGDIKEDIDPKVISKITDNFDTGFAPFNSDDDESSSLSSLSSK